MTDDAVGESIAKRVIGMTWLDGLVQAFDLHRRAARFRKLWRVPMRKTGKGLVKDYATEAQSQSNLSVAPLVL